MALLDNLSGDPSVRPCGVHAAKVKLNELYMAWLLLPEAQQLIAKFAPPGCGLSVKVDGNGLHAPAFGSPPRSPKSPKSSFSPSRRQKPLSPCVDEMDAVHRHGGLSPRHSPALGASRSPSPTGDAALPTASVSTAFAQLELPTKAQPGPAPPVPARRLTGEQRVAVPQFFFPKGKPIQREEAERQQQQLRKMWEIKKPSRGAAAMVGRQSAAVQAPRRSTQGATETRSYTQKTFPDVASRGCGLPKWMSSLVFRRALAWEPAAESQQGWRQRAAALTVHPTNTVLHYQRFRDFFDAELSGRSPERRLFDIIKSDPTRDYIVRDDLRPIVEEVLNVHSGLEFLKQTPDFQERYADTVQVRMLYSANLKDDGKLSWSEWKRSSLPAVLHALDEESDINVSQKTECFSYEHFYVLYCKFWELDTDHDFLISRDDLSKYANYSLTNTIIDRVFCGRGRRRKPQHPGKMTYEEFIWFCLCEEDKSSHQALEYWFRCVDLDGDGLLSGFELAHFFAEQKTRMEASYQETIAWEDILCQMVDIIKPRKKGSICLADVKRCRLSGNFFNALFNLNKFIAFEQRDPFAAHAERQLPEKTDWDKFAKVEYERMSHEAGEEDAAMLREYGNIGQWRADEG